MSTETVVSQKFSSKWSLPAHVVEVKDKVLVVQPWGRQNTSHQIPVSKVRRLQGMVPPSLQLLNLALLEVEEPHLRSYFLSSRKRVLPPVEFKSLLDQSSLPATTMKKPRLVPVLLRPQPSVISTSAAQVAKES